MVDNLHFIGGNNENNGSELSENRNEGKDIKETVDDEDMLF